MVLTFTEEDIKSCVLEDGKSVIVTITNSGYMLYTLNMLKSLVPYGWDRKVLVVCMDHDASQRIRERGNISVVVEEQKLDRFCSWNTKGYEEICYWKLATIYRLLSMNKNVILVDGDIVFRRDPSPDWRQWWSDRVYDVWIQNDSQLDRDTTNMCTGYMMIRSTPQMITVYDCISEQGRRKYDECIFDNNDQTYFNRYVKPSCRFLPLLLEHYPNGKMYTENKSKIDGKCILVHFNWIKGHFKLITMKQNGMWLLTPDEEK
jgi:hypothetical protein